MSEPTFVEPTAAEAQRLRHLADALADGAEGLRWVDYEQAERDVRQLAEQLRQAMTADELRRSRWRAIPRGGFIVLGMLAYALDLPAAALAEDLSGGTVPGPVILVDDCALSGVRLGAAIAGCDASQIVVAHLYSHPELRRQVLAREERVRHCLAARDLTSRGASDDPRWQAAWRARLGPERYWIGRTERLAFPWNEPDQPFWNAATATIEDGWRFVPPHRCLKSSRLLGGSVEAGARRLAEGVAYGEFDDCLWLCHLASKQIFGLDEVGADCLKALLRCADLEGAARRLADRYQAPEEVLARDLAALARSLEARGLLAAP
ncbi:MAG: PqqD family protein [Acidobacteriota bacterium]